MPAKDDGSGGSEDSESDEEDSDESDESSEEEEDDYDEDEEGEEKEDDPLSLEWPDTRRKQATYLFLLPIVFPLWLTVPDVRNPVRDTRMFLMQSFKSYCILLLHHQLCPIEIQKILCGHLPGLHSVDCHFLVPHGVVGSSGQLI